MLNSSVNDNSWACMTQGRKRGTLEKELAARIMSMKRSDEGPSEFGRRVGLNAQLVNNYESGRHGATMEIALRVHRKTGTSLEWLIGGDGAPPVESDAEKAFREIAAVVDRYRGVTSTPGSDVAADLAELLQRADASVGQELQRRAELLNPPTEAQG